MINKLRNHLSGSFLYLKFRKKGVNNIINAGQVPCDLKFLDTLPV